MNQTKLTLIAAMSRNSVLAAGGKIPWHLPRDVAHFRARAAGHWLLLGRTTFEQMTGWFKPGQVPVVLTRQPDYSVPGGKVVASVEQAMAMASAHGVEELLVCGGGQVYAAALPFADRVILTVVDMEVSGETRFPSLDPEVWEVLEEEGFPADDSNLQAMTIQHVARRC